VGAELSLTRGGRPGGCVHEEGFVAWSQTGLGYRDPWLAGIPRRPDQLALLAALGWGVQADPVRIGRRRVGQLVAADHARWPDGEQPPGLIHAARDRHGQVHPGGFAGSLRCSGRVRPARGGPRQRCRMRGARAGGVAARRQWRCRSRPFRAADRRFDHCLWCWSATGGCAARECSLRSWWRCVRFVGG
jgi:hypothetical protein